jgi:predicted PurR-regulated permease PerM
MENQQNEMNKSKFINWSIESAIQIGLVALIVISSYIIFKPFIVPVAWGIIIAVALFPVAKKMNSILGERKNLTAIILTVLVLALVIIPTFLFTSSIVESVQNFSNDIEEGKLSITLPEDTSDLSPAKKYVIEKWQNISQNIEETLTKFAPQLKEAGQFLLSTIAGLGGALLMFIVSIIIAGVFLSNAKGGYDVTFTIFKKLTGNRAVELVNLSISTIRSVMQGVIGVAVIQAALVGIGFFVAGVPGASVLTLIVMIMAIVQIPPIIVIIPVIVYVYSTASSGVAIAFAVWSILASLSDNVLKPMLLGRGMDIPMLVILIGALGGMIALGMIGLFVGPVILALAYQLFQAWLIEDDGLKTAEDVSASLKD